MPLIFAILFTITVAELTHWRAFASVQTGANNNTAAESACHLENFTVNFHAAGLSNVLVPTSYNARQCVGLCTISKFKADDHISLHAQVLASAASVYALNPDRFDKEPKLPCCVPLTYQEISLVLFDNGHVSVFSGPMIATSCGCR